MLVPTVAGIRAVRKVGDNVILVDLDSGEALDVISEAQLEADYRPNDELER